MHRQPRDYWEFQSERDHWIGVVGYEYGQDPLLEQSRILEDKRRLAERIRRDLGVQPNHHGLEIGSGCGFLTERIAPHCARLHACDISATYLREVAKRCVAFGNVFCHHLTSCSLPAQDIPLDFIYASAVFIHLDLYEIGQYLESAAAALRPGGALWFDVLEAERMRFHGNSDFAGARAMKAADPFNKNCLQYNSLKAILRLAKELGFHVVRLDRKDRALTWVVLRKGRPSLRDRLGLASSRMLGPVRRAALRQLIGAK